MGYSPWGCKESEMTEQVTHTHSYGLPTESKKWHKCMYLQSRNRVLDVENKLLAIAGESIWDNLREWG